MQVWRRRCLTKLKILDRNYIATIFHQFWKNIVYFFAKLKSRNQIENEVGEIGAKKIIVGKKIISGATRPLCRLLG